MPAVPIRLDGFSAFVADATCGGASFVLSPHLDDAALSVGSLIADLAKLGPVTVITIFTESGPNVTMSARAFVRQCGYRQASILYSDRRSEDRLALTSVGATAIHLGIPDALFRCQDPKRFVRRVSRLLPEFNACYATYRFHVSSGKVSVRDSTLRATLLDTIGKLTVGAAIVLAPVGFGDHVDHVLTNEVAASLALTRPVIYYADQPYAAARGTSDPPSVPGLRAARLAVDRKVKGSLVEKYKSQVPALFGSGDIPYLAEYLYVPPSLIPLMS